MNAAGAFCHLRSMLNASEHCQDLAVTGCVCVRGLEKQVPQLGHHYLQTGKKCVVAKAYGAWEAR